MNYNKYKSGPGLDRICLKKLFTYLEEFNKDHINIIENVIPRLFDKKKTIFAKNIKIGYPGKCG